jgi:AhpD family alkylhydroperoxidase
MELLGTVQSLFKEMKENKSVGAFLRFSSQVKSGGVLDEKTKDLILVALSVCCQCDWCIAVHVRSAVEKGATKDEVVDAAMQAVLMGGGPKLMYMHVVNQELKKYYFNDE